MEIKFGRQAQFRGRGLRGKENAKAGRLNLEEASKISRTRFERGRERQGGASEFGRRNKLRGRGLQRRRQVDSWEVDKPYGQDRPHVHF